MMFSLKRCSVAALIICFLAIASISSAKPRIFTTIDYPGAVLTVAYGINPAGDIVGGYSDSTNYSRGFVFRNGIFTSLEWPGATWTEAYGINPQGDIVGQYGWDDGVTRTVHGFLLRHGVMYPIDVDGQQNTMPFKITAEGMIVGCNHHNVTNAGGTDLNTMRGFTLDAAGVTHTMIRSMNTGANPDGDVVGYYFGTPSNTPSARAEWSYVIRDGVISWFQFPGSFATLANDISPSGTIVGAHRITNQVPAVFHGFIMEDGEFYSFDVPEATQTRAFGVNPRGDIVGYYSDASGVIHGFLRAKRDGRPGEYANSATVETSPVVGVTLDQSVPDLGTYNLQNRFYSTRTVDSGTPTQPPRDWYIVLFDQTNYRGTPTNYNDSAENIDRRARSVTIGRGVWELCDLSGRCTILSRSVPDLRSYDIGNRILSVRPFRQQPR